MKTTFCQEMGLFGPWIGDLWTRKTALGNASLLPCMIPLGLIFGLVTAVGFTRRLRRLAQASSALASGDLARRVHDPSGDEIGQLTRQFNHMAGQIEADTTQLRELAERNARLARQAQRLAALEERHRLARELHDGVKQHLFGVNLAAAAALNLLEADPEVARTRLLEAKEHSRQAQAESLTISECTVKSHVSNILSKLQLAHRTQAALYALKRGLVPFDDAHRGNH